jgi:hypothetical protein
VNGHNLIPPTDLLTADVRLFLSRRLIERIFRNIGMGNIFSQSQSWEGYNRACESWHAAFWRWVDQQCPARLVKNVKEAGDWSRTSVANAIDLLTSGGMDCSKLPPTVDEKKQWLAEFARQEMLQRYAVFSLAMRGPEAQDSETYKKYANDMKIAAQIGDDSYFQALARQKQRKPTKDKGDRRLKPQLLVYWIPGCLWAFTNDGISAFLSDLYPRINKATRHSQAISNAHRSLKLYHSPKPLYWGVTGSPPSLVALS